MAQKVRVWFDPEGDFLEVLFSDKPGGEMNPNSPFFHPIGIFLVSDTRALAFAFVTHIVPYFIHTLAGFVCALRENVRWSDLSQPAAEK